ncbi:MAG: DUF255 domain-containing protein [Bacteroidota bacterium]
MKFFLKYSLLLIPFVLLTSFKPDLKPQKANKELKWYSWNEGYEKAVKEGKIVLVDAYTDWCGWCKRMDRDTYSDSAVIKKINDNFVPIKFNPEIADASYKVGDQTYNPEQLYRMLTRGESTGFPTTYYIYPKKMGIFIDPGYKDAKAFLTVLDMAIAESKR